MADSSVLLPDIQAGNHKGYLKLALSLATQSPPRPTNYRVGAVLLDTATNKILSTGYTLELPGNTHAEQCCFEKLASKHGIDSGNLSEVLPDEVALYTTMEPCSFRLSGNLPCVDRILGIGSKIKTVYVGVKEPEKFVNNNSGKAKLQGAGISFVHIEGLETDILKVATAGHGAAEK
ncbi:putative CMP/dCMP-type deaminase domain-containing protein [Seiridium cardinale]|uniref:CMP/dCMP-type deaminase domain-containing protein n=1 Tax=Seiridium cardinale TaxID=138064 RepID=A0ABR2Y1Q4_9PEZI